MCIKHYFGSLVRIYLFYEKKIQYLEVTDVTVCKMNAKAGITASPKGRIVSSSRVFPCCLLENHSPLLKYLTRN